MAPAVPKRPASSSPDGERAAKRMATSSPEEGEVDDASPLAATTPIILPASLPSKPIVAKPKVPFPFKRKLDSLPANGPSPSFTGARDTVLPAVYERSDDIERRLREPDSARGRGSRYIGKLNTSDHWEPSYGRGHSRSHTNGWRDYSNQDHGERERDRSPLSRKSASYSRSPSSPPSGNREKHRLPTHKSPEITFSPPTRSYGLDSFRDRERERGMDWDRERERRYRDDDDRYYSGRGGDVDDRHYRPSHAQHDFRREEVRDWSRREDAYDMDRRIRRPDYRGRDEASYDYGHEYHDGHIPNDVDVPEQSTRSNPASPATKQLPPPVPQPLPALPGLNESEPNEPRPPSSSPPPPPPPDARLAHNTNQVLPPVHEKVSFSIKPPAAPRGVHSPPPLLPPPKDNVVNNMEKSKENDSKIIRQLRKKQIIRRSRKEEMALYGREFKGCGMQNDYEVTTKLGEGTFGEVHKAIHKTTGNSVALKRILMHNEKEGMPVTALREIKILKALNHPCIVEILDMFVVRSSDKDPLSVYMVFPYMDHDLAGLLENERVKLQPSHIKLYMRQLLEGTEYMHRNHILHRDMKAANLLISNTGSLRIADFGLARSFDVNVGRGISDHRGRERKYTNCVVTRWYRPPELLLGARQYGGEVDIWGIGCVLGEMFMRRPILPGNSDLDQLDKIWHLCGSPNQHTWPNYDSLPGCEGIKRFPNYSRRLKTAFEDIGPETCDLLDKLLTCNPRERITASQALDHDYFWTDPLPADPKTLPSYESSHEFDKRGHGHRNHAPVGIPPHPAPHPEGHPRHLPPPTGQSLHYGRGHHPPPPTREMLYQGPPPHHFPPKPSLPPPQGFNNHQFSHDQRNYPYGRPPPPVPHGVPCPPRNPHGPPSYPNQRQNHHGPRTDRWEPRQPRPAHLPPRPPPPTNIRDMNSGPRGPDRRPGDSGVTGGGGGGELNYG